MLLCVFESTKLLDLTVDHLLTNGKLFLEPGFFTVFALLVHHQLLLSECFYPSLLCQLLLSDKFSLTDLVGVCLHDISLDLCCFLLSLQLSDLFAFEVFFSLALYQLPLEHLLFELLDVVYLELV